MIKAVFFDVANTLLHKPDLFARIRQILASHKISIETLTLQRLHKLLSEQITFPDKTSKIFYNNFNRELLYLLGLIPEEEMINEIFYACKHLMWKPFDDLHVLEKIQVPLGVLSNWDSSLSTKLSEHFNYDFRWIIGSEQEGIRKPSEGFYKAAINKSGLAPNEIIYVGDSVKLDIEPAHRLGLKVVLIDRLDSYKSSNISRINNMNQILNYL